MYCTTDQKVVDGWHSQAWWQTGDQLIHGPKAVRWAELWWKVGCVARTSQRRVTLVLVESHIHHEDFAQGFNSGYALVGNGLADTLAGKGADASAVPAGAVKAHRDKFEPAKLVQARIAVAMELDKPAVHPFLPSSQRRRHSSADCGSSSSA